MQNTTRPNTHPIAFRRIAGSCLVAAAMLNGMTSPAVAAYGAASAQPSVAVLGSADAADMELLRLASSGNAVLTQGFRGEVVSALQRALNIKADGIYGPATRRAVIVYQLEHRVRSTGNVGPLTWAALGVNDRDVAKERLEYLAKGPRVLAVQRLLKVEPASGFFGQTTLAAVRELQRKQGLSPVGNVGPRTWLALLAVGARTPERSGGTASLPAELSLSPEGAEWIAHHEGTSLKPYEDVAGYCTIGIGHLIGRRHCTAAERRWRWTEEHALDVFRADVNSIGKNRGAATKVRKRYSKVPMTQAQFDTLVSFAFNLGSVSQNSLKRALDARPPRYERVPAALRLFIRAGNKEICGLRNRREAEAYLWSEGVYRTMRIC